MEAWYAMVQFFTNGGVFMFPIVLVLALGVGIAVERYVTLSLAAKKNRETWEKLDPMIKKGEFEQARELAAKDDSTISQLLVAGLARQAAVRRREDIDRAMEETLMAIIPRLEKRTHYLATFANMSTLAGLLGTIIGLIDAFTAVSKADIADKAELLSASISIGMNCTAFGLMVAIPLVLVHSLLQTKTTEIIDSLEMVSVRIVNSIAERASYVRPAFKRGDEPAPIATEAPIPSNA
ncbi:MAG TPA: MotA/TolQ/ExbB proton channel family protein [Gammaproteobacteria bacterium]|nr:MotA/TolQ/ExbB proton channel family protein [Gammaproteobacteria bacterium]